MASDEIYKGCASTLPSTATPKSFPNVEVLTFAGVSVVSLRFCPVRALSLCHVNTLTCPCNADANTSGAQNAMVLRRWPSASIYTIYTRKRSGENLTDKPKGSWAMNSFVHKNPNVIDLVQDSFEAPRLQ